MQHRIVLALLLLLALASGAGAVAAVQWTHAGTLPLYQQISEPYLAVNHTGHLFVTDQYGQTVSTFSPDGSGPTPFLTSNQLTTLQGLGPYVSPKGIAVNSSDFVIVVIENTPYPAIIFDRSGQEKKRLLVNSSTGFTYYDVGITSNDEIYIFGSYNSVNVIFKFNRGGDYIGPSFALDNLKSGATGFGSQTVGVSSVGGIGSVFNPDMFEASSLNDLYHPFDAAVDPLTGQILVSGLQLIEQTSVRTPGGYGVVKIFDPATSTNPIASVDYTFLNPTGIAITPDGSTLYVATGNQHDTQPPQVNGDRSPRTRGVNPTSISIEVFHRAPSGLTPSFVGYPQSGTAPHTVQFLDYTAGAASWRWDFGDGGTSELQYPSHIYEHPGLYTVSLTVSDGEGRTGTKTEYHYIRVTDPIGPAPTPVANFTANTTSGPAPLAVQFTDQSGPSPFHWWWQFGDGASSTDQHPVHTYPQAGTYSVNLTAWTPIGSVSVSKLAYVTVGGDPRAPVANFTMNRDAGKAPLYVRFTDTSTGDPTSWRWDFGGFAWTTARNPTQVFARTGTHTVTLTVSNPYGTSSISKNVTVGNVTPTPTVTVTPTPTVTSSPTPSPFVPMTLPGRVQAEDYDQGGEGVAYHDTTPGNEGRTYRQDDVDIERIDTGDTTPNVGWIRAGEFLTYTVNVATAGTYDMNARVSSNRTGRHFEVYLDGEAVPRTRVAVPKTVTTIAANVTVPYTREWEYFTTVDTLIDLPAGTHTLRFQFPMDYMNLNWMDFNLRA
ncbi:PKD domain protein [anaerobic digester metagenome]